MSRLPTALLFLASCLFLVMTIMVLPSSAAPAPASSDSDSTSALLREDNPDHGESFFHYTPAQLSHANINPPYEVKVRNRNVIQRLLAERYHSGFRMHRLTPYEITVHADPSGRPPELATEAHRLLHTSTTLVSRVPRETSTHSRALNSPTVWYLMTPAPVNKRWYDLMHLDYNSETRTKQPILVYEWVHNPRGRIPHHSRLIGVEISEGREDLFNFLQRWIASKGV